jgi:hypothetical protein
MLYMVYECENFISSGRFFNKVLAVFSDLHPPIACKMDPAGFALTGKDFLWFYVNPWRVMSKYFKKIQFIRKCIVGIEYMIYLIYRLS